MTPITEKELDTAAGSKAIENLRIQQLDNDEFAVVVKLTWRPEELTLVTQRKKVRGWVNLTLLMKHIRDKYGIVSEIKVTLIGEPK